MTCEFCPQCESISRCSECFEEGDVCILPVNALCCHCDGWLYD